MAETVRCVVEEGFAVASARHIADRAGVTWGVIQYHFGDRDGLLMAVVDDGFVQLLDALRTYRETSSPQTVRQRADGIVTATWAAFSTPISRAALEILVATRATREPAASQHLSQLSAALTELGRQIGQGLQASQGTAVGNLLWSALRGMVLAQMVVAAELDTARERRQLVDVIVAYVERHRAA